MAENAFEEDLRLGLTPEFLLEEYIHKDRGLQDIADEFSVGVKKVRGALKRANIQKSPDQLRAKRSRIGKERTAVTSNFHKFTTEQNKEAQLLATKSRQINRLKKLQEAGLTEPRLRQL